MRLQKAYLVGDMHHLGLLTSNYHTFAMNIKNFGSIFFTSLMYTAIVKKSKFGNLVFRIFFSDLDQDLEDPLQASYILRKNNLIIIIL